LKRDMGLIRELLQMLEAESTDRGFSFEEGEAETLKRTLDEIRYNLEQAVQMGLIEVGSKPLTGPLIIRGLTPSGHDFLKRGRRSLDLGIGAVTDEIGALAPFPTSQVKE
jgi:Hypothetical protein (DUF2513)